MVFWQFWLSDDERWPKFNRTGFLPIMDLLLGLFSQRNKKGTLGWNQENCQKTLISAMAFLQFWLSDDEWWPELTRPASSYYGSCGSVKRRSHASYLFQLKEEERKKPRLKSGELSENPTYSWDEAGVAAPWEFNLSARFLVKYKVKSQVSDYREG